MNCTAWCSSASSGGGDMPGRASERLWSLKSLPGSMAPSSSHGNRKRTVLQSPSEPLTLLALVGPQVVHVLARPDLGAVPEIGGVLAHLHQPPRVHVERRALLGIEDRHEETLPSGAMPEVK